MAEPITLIMPQGVKFETEMSVESARAHAIQAAVTFHAGRQVTKQDIIRLADDFFHYIATGKKPDHDRGW